MPHFYAAEVGKPFTPHGPLRYDLVILFCPFCGTKTVDEGVQRTYCTTCGEDIPTPGQIEELTDQLAEMEKDRDGWVKEAQRISENLETEEAKVLKLYEEIDELKRALEQAETERDIGTPPWG